MTGIERIGNILRREPVDRIGLFEHFWDDTRKAYVRQGHVPSGESLEDHFKLDMRECWPFNYTADIHFKDEVLEETDETILTKNGNGAVLRRHKLHDSTPEHVAYTVTSSEEWPEYPELLTNITEDRIDFEAYRKAKKAAHDAGSFFVWSGVNVFECIHPLCGHENMLAGMLLEPEWFLDMAKVYTDLNIHLQEILFAKEGKPDGIWYYEDMGYKEKPFMSPNMYRELIQPSHKRSIDFAKSMGLPVIMHSCGYVRPLLPYIVESGIDCLQVIEIKAGMDLLEIYKNFGEKIALMGGIDARVLNTNDRRLIDRELESKIPIVKEGFGFVMHSDHSIPESVDYDTLHYIIDKGLELGTY